MLLALVTLVLSYNFVASSCGIFLLGSNLLMGLAVSPEALGTTAIAAEIKNLATPKFSLKLPHLNLIVLIEIFRRYVDDTSGIITGDSIDELLEGIEHLAKTYLASHTI